MISINSLTVAYGGFTLLNDINFHISESDKIGLVGKNGAGKSTILKLICGLQSPTNGKVAVPNGVKIGYLPQIMEHYRGRTVIDEAMTAFSDMFAQEAELEKVTQELAERTDYESQEYHDLIVRMNEINDRLLYTRSDNPQVQAEKTLIGLGFKYEELSRPTETFSQGWNMRIELAKILLSKPDVLLLDEPTNNLDIYHASNMMRTVRRLCDELGKTVILVLHEINYASFYSDYICALVDGKIAKFGTVEEVINKETLSEIYKVDFEIIHVDGKPLSVYY